MDHCILLVEDDPLHRDMLAEALADQRYRVASAASGQEALDAISQQNFPVALVDIRLPDLDGRDLLDILLERQPGCAVLLMTGQASVEAAVTAMKRGAFDYLAKPFKMELLLMKLERLFHLKVLEAENRQLKGGAGSSGIVATSAVMRRFLTTAGSVAATTATVLLQGESGTGKELVADLIHDQSSLRGGPLVKVNCGAIPENLLESELFGYEKGAFTGAERRHRGYLEQAHQGTLFLDEVGEIPPAMQVKLLRVLQDHKVQRLGGEEVVASTFRLITATHRDLAELRDSGTIREDFFYRLNVVPLNLPPLRDRLDDLPLLIEHFIGKYASTHRSAPIRLAPETLEQLQRYSFPGNVRELGNLIERLQVLCPGETITPSQLPAECRRAGSGATDVIQCYRTDLTLREALRDFEARFIQRVLQEENGNRTAAARRLGISRKNLWEKL